MLLKAVRNARRWAELYMLTDYIAHIRNTTHSFDVHSFFATLADPGSTCAAEGQEGALLFAVLARVSSKLIPQILIYTSDFGC